MLIVTAVLVVVALLGGGVVAWRLLSGGGGAPSGIEAATLLAADLQDANYISAASRLHPDETALLTELNTVLADELVRLEVIRPDAKDFTSPKGLTFKDLRFDAADVENVRDDVVISKLVAGTITIDQGGEQPFTDQFRDLVYPDGVPTAGPTTIDIADVVAEQGEPLRIASVRVDGEWYVSLFYTAADYALRANGEAWPKTSIAPRGAATAEDALKETVQAALDTDARRLVELASPSELQVVHDVGDAIVASAGSGEPSGAKLLELETAPAEVNGKKALTVNKAVIGSDRGGETTVTREGDCLIATTAAAPPERFCTDELIGESDLSVNSPQLPILRKVVPVLFNPKIVVEELDGQFYVSPVRTFGGLYGDVLAVLTPEDVRTLIKSMQ